MKGFKNSAARTSIILVVALVLVLSMATVVLAKGSINKNTNNPSVIGNSGLISSEAKPDEYKSSEVKNVVTSINNNKDMDAQEIINALPKNDKKSDAQAFPTTDGYNVNLEMYDRITDFYDIKNSNGSNATPGKIQLKVPECQNMKGDDLLVLVLDSKTGEMHIVAPIKFDSDNAVIELNMPCVGAYCVLHKLPLVVGNVNPDLYPNEVLAAAIRSLMGKNSLECTEFLKATLAEEDKDKLEKLEVADGVTINPEDYSSAIALSDVAIQLSQGDSEYSYNLSTKFKANLFKGNDQVDWERILKYEGIDYDADEATKDDKALTEIEPFTLEDSFVYHIDAVTGEVSIIYEPTVYWATYGDMSNETETDFTEDDISYFDVDDINAQNTGENAFNNSGEESEKTSFLGEILTNVYAADLNLDEIDENSQALNEDDVCLVMKGDNYVGMGPFIMFMPKKEVKAGFPWWIVALVVVAGGFVYYKKSKNKDSKQAA